MVGQFTLIVERGPCRNRGNAPATGRMGGGASFQPQIVRVLLIPSFGRAPMHADAPFVDGGPGRRLADIVRPSGETGAAVRCHGKSP
jgi:hypothetical protein